LRGIYSRHPPKQLSGQAAANGRPGHCPVRQPCHPTVRVLTQSTVGALTSGGTGQSGVAPDGHCSLSGAPLTSALISAMNCSAVRGTVQSTVVPKSRCSTGASDSLVAHRTVR
jgi:hypothetical protein